ncbi:hypothetical protein [Sphingobacterium luzhongxinii]|uniref:hypothetical protein n=1 Tax=Sphingobacterium luzhongxinii TaxID=2654181 RepID=UPI0013DC0354|nr:hypothetical protein [Sphingobacterium sp. xlx-73]
METNILIVGAIAILVNLVIILIFVSKLNAIIKENKKSNIILNRLLDASGGRLEPQEKIFVEK